MTRLLMIAVVCAAVAIPVGCDNPNYIHGQATYSYGRDYVYYPGNYVYYDRDRHLYFYPRHERWEHSEHLPPGIRLWRNHLVRLHLNTERPWEHFENHRHGYPPRAERIQGPRRGEGHAHGGEGGHFEHGGRGGYSGRGGRH